MKTRIVGISPDNKPCDYTNSWIGTQFGVPIMIVDESVLPNTIETSTRHYQITKEIGSTFTPYGGGFLQFECIEIDKIHQTPERLVSLSQWAFLGNAEETPKPEEKEILPFDIVEHEYSYWDGKRR